MFDLSDNVISLALRSKRVSEIQVSDIESVYCIIAADQLDANDFHCYLIVFETEMWLLPDDTDGIAVLGQLKDSAGIAEKVKVVNVAFLPYRWRTTWGFLPGVRPNLKILPKSELELFKGSSSELPEYDRKYSFLL